MQKVWALTKGFTIIELLVSIVIIGILITITTVSYTGIQQRSRDTERESHITKIKIALEKYHAEKSGYPDVCAGGDNTDCAASMLSTVLKPYLETFPHDPRAVADSATDYRYIRGTLASDSYGLLVTREAKPACKTGTRISSTWWTPAVLNC